MRVLILCERSDIVRQAFEDEGHEAWSCDLEETHGRKSRHFVCDAFDAMPVVREYDLIIAHPPCTALCVSGNRYYANSLDRQIAINWTIKLWNRMKKVAPRIALENPVGVLSTAWHRPAQYIQPYHYGHDASKRTGLWLHGLPKLRPTGMVQAGPNGYWGNQTKSGQNKLPPSDDRAELRAKTYPGIAAAMADQWSRE